MKKSVDKIGKRIILKLMGNKSVAQEVVRKTYKLKLVPKNKEQVNDLLRLVTQFRQACNYAINFLYQAKESGTNIKSFTKLQKEVYHDIRKIVPNLGADYVTSAIKVTMQTWKSQIALKNAKKRIEFKNLFACGTRHTCTVYNDQTISISVPGIDKMYRIKLPF